ncbi:MAG TPA: TonB-dependent receptor [Gammaproteobacteria bacterium]|nr:TonB-dependent receptor [Gammaproteobacteria bacterium]
MARKPARSIGAFAAMLAAFAAQADPHDAPPVHLGEIVVNGTPLPVPGLGLPLDKVPANVQMLGEDDIAHQATARLTDLLRRNFGSVHITNGQNNPFQPDISFRGFDASPLLGTPEALSIYVDGVRVNEPFGDVVNFDLIPLVAIKQITLISGSNPVYGLNTLGGALSFETKSGFDAEGIAGSAFTGSFGTHSATVQYGDHSGHFGYYVAANHYDSNGWAAHNPSRVNQLFVKGSYRGGGTALDLSFTGANNHLEGNQMLPLSFLDNPDQSYTYPDYFNNQVAFVVLDVRHSFTDTLALVGNLYNRVLDTGGMDSDVSDGFDPAQPVRVDNSPSFNDFNSTHEHGYGGSAQLVASSPIGGHDNRVVVGVSANLGSVNFAQGQQAAKFVHRGSVGIGPIEPRTRLDAHNRYYGLYATDTLSLTDAVALTLSGRYNHAHVELDDQLGTALNGEHNYSRLNPAVGLTWNPAESLTTWLSYDESTRTPTPSELTCADPEAPCSLPNSFLADPPLEQVVAQTWEAGARGRLGELFSWNAVLYRTDLENDLLFISVTGLRGFYKNVPGDRRQGVELGIRGSVDQLTFSANYSYIEATYQSAFTESSPSNSSASDTGLLTVAPGDWMPGIPRHSVKLSAEYAFTSRFSLGADLIARSSIYARGDENNEDNHGQVPGYATVHLDAHYYPAPAWDIFLSVDNLFNRRYANYGQLGENVFANSAKRFDAANAVDTQFRAVGPPRTIWFGFSYSMI